MRARAEARARRSRLCVGLAGAAGFAGRVRLFGTAGFAAHDLLPGVAAFGAAVAVFGGCGNGAPHAGFGWERMIEQGKVDAYEPSSLFADGKAMRAPPSGTVARETAGGGVMATGRTGPGATAGYVQMVPLRLTPGDVEHGRERFDIYCAVCHGINGYGTSAVARSMKLRPPPPLHQPRIRAMPAGRLFEVITEGYGLMPSYAGPLDVRQRWEVVAYVEALLLSRNADVTALPAGVRRELERAAAQPTGGAAGADSARARRPS